MGLAVNLLVVLKMVSFAIGHGQARLIAFDKVSRITESLTQSIIDIAEKYFARDAPIGVLIPSKAAPHAWAIHREGEFLLEELNKQMIHPLISLDYHKKSQFKAKYTKPGSYILLISGESDSISTMTFNMLSTIFETANTNTSARLLIALTTVPKTQSHQISAARTLLQIVWKALDISDVVAIVPNPPSRSGVKHSVIAFGVFNWIPIQQRDPCFKVLNKIEHADSWLIKTKCFLNNVDLYPNKYVTDMRGCILKAKIQEYTPYVARLDDSLLGVIPTAIGLIKQLLNLRITYSFVEVDPDLVFAVPYLFDMSVIAHDSALIYPHLQDNFKWFVPAGAPIPRWKSLTKIFNPLMWFCVLVVFISGSLTTHLLKNHSNKDNQNKRNYSSALLDTLLTYLAMGVSDRYKGIIPGTFFLFWLFYCLNINTAYQSALISFLADPGEYPPIRTIAELYKSELELLSMIEFSGPIDQGLIELEKYNRCSSFIYCIVNILKYRNIAVLTNEFQGRRIVLDTFSAESNKPAVLAINEVIQKVLIGMYINTHGSLLYKSIEVLMHRFITFGFIGNYLDTYRDLENTFFSELMNEKPSVLTLSHLQGAFYLLGCGIFTSILTFLLEIKSYFFKRKTKLMQYMSCLWNNSCM
ncbi:Ionotropic receptor 434 [Blattella germanica]|nr:Ionotropic receptor 434 [Blattella germanica]